MEKFGKIAVLSVALLGATAPDLADANPTTPPAVQAVSDRVSPRMSGIINCDDPSPATLNSALRGTDQELQFELAQKRREITCISPQMKWFDYPDGISEEGVALSQEMSAMSTKIDTLTTLSDQIGIGYYGVDMHLDFNHNGQSLGFSYEEGEGSYLGFHIGSKKYGINLNSFPASAVLSSQITDNAPSFTELSTNPAKAREINQALDVVIAGMQALLAQPPVYRKLVESSAVISNGGLNVRDDNERVKAKAPFGTYFQVIGAPENGYVFTYFMGDNGLDAGWVSEKYLGDPQSSYNQNTDQRIEHPVIAHMRVNETSADNGGLNLRTSNTTEATIIGKIPVGTVVEVLEKSAPIGNKQWARVRYTDPSTKKIMEGWACIYQPGYEFMNDVK